jgi:hypothetical protein
MRVRTVGWGIAPKSLLPPAPGCLATISLQHICHVLCPCSVNAKELWLTTDEWIKKMWYLYTMEFYAAMKKNEMLSFAGKWMELENIILSEVSLAQKTTNPMFSLICGH